MTNRSETCYECDGCSCEEADMNEIGEMEAAPTLREVLTSGLRRLLNTKMVWYMAGLGDAMIMVYLYIKFFA